MIGALIFILAIAILAGIPAVYGYRHNGQEN